MSKGFNFIVNVVAGLLVIILVLTVVGIANFFYQSDTNLIDIIDPGTILIVISIILCALIIRSGLIKAINREKHLRPEKASVYKRFVDYFYTGLPMDDGWHELTAAMTLWASDSVLRQYFQLIKMMEEKELYDKIQQKAEKVLMEIRKDMGNTNLGILNGDIIHTEKRFEKYESKTKAPQVETV